MIRLGLVFLACFVLAACGKKISPQEVRQSRLDWNLKTLVDAYQKIGNTDSKWDGPATNALAEFARSRTGLFESDEDWGEIIRTNCEAAVEAGCDDPMIRYLYIRFSMSQTNSPQDFADAFCKVENDMQESSYPSIRKFYTSLRALSQFYYAYTNADVMTLQKLADDTIESLVETLDDKTTPVDEVYDACHQTLMNWSGDKARYQNCYRRMEQPLFKNWPKESISWLLKGEAYISLGSIDRGNGYANTITKEGWKLYAEDLDVAEKSLNRAWELNSKNPWIAVEMIWVELGQGQGRDRMELWFNRAMALDTNYYDACSTKLYYLEPKWYGSMDDMLEFGHECVTNKLWGGHIPLILMDAHISIYNQYIDDSEKKDYWKQPEVWTDIKSAFDRFFELNPDDISWYHNYAWYAYHAEDWDTLNEIIPKLGSVNYTYFGGKDEFDKMVELAKEHASKLAAPLPQ